MMGLKKGLKKGLDEEFKKLLWQEQVVSLKNCSSKSKLFHNIVTMMQRQCTHHKVAPGGAMTKDPIL